MNPNATKSHESVLTGTGINQHYLFLIEQVFNYLTLLVIFSLFGHTSTVDVGHKLLEVSRMTLIYRKLVLISTPPPEFRPIYLRDRSLLITWVGWGRRIFLGGNHLILRRKKGGISRNREPKWGINENFGSIQRGDHSNLLGK